jgi:hypothetical protein
MFSDFIDHFSGMDDKQIVKDVRKSIEDLAEGNSRGKSFGAFIVKSTNDRIAKVRKKKVEAGRKGGLAFAAKYRKNKELTAQNNDQVTTTQISTNDPVLTTPTAGGSCGTFRGSAKTQGDSNTSCTVPAVCPESGKPLATTPVTTTPISTDEDRQSQRTGAAPERVKNDKPVSHSGKAPVRSFGEYGLVHLTDTQADNLRTYYGEDFDRAVGILENYMLGLPSKADGDDKGNSKCWREEYAARNHYYVMRKDSWVDNALKRAKTEDARLEKATNTPKSFKQADTDARTEFFSKSIFDKEVV